MKQNPIFIVDDDEDDLELIREAVKHLGIERPIHYFDSGTALEQFMATSDAPPFVIICDVNLRGETGFEVRKRVAENTQLKYSSVPFVFWSNGASEQQIQLAYDLPAQGFFIKPDNFQNLCDTFKTILDYWQKSQHPKRVV